MSTTTAKRCRCGEPFQCRVVDVLNRPIPKGLKAAERARMLEKASRTDPWYWCLRCDRVAA